ncbi:Rv3235 family protein [Tessaracoccus caeni]|uniref:Rv3235 family protein n=1 Tax=Tessaracoccus caeni TaxID=3031239 RepID=UPI0023DBF9BE|nr:Rv3235 family protein [Tessaracoccus caeni]MDF1488445.1 Rv3235 family protein [Tessaracoccus caeni]
MNPSHSLTVKIGRPLPAVPAPPAPVPPTPVPRVAEALVRALFESMTGRRPLHQLRRLVAGPAFARLAQHAASGAFRTARLAGIRFQMPTPTAVEAVVRLAAASRWLVCVIRLDLRDSWGCTDFAVLGYDDAKGARP